MELWIRSQNKMNLILNPKLHIDVLEDGVWIVDISNDKYWKLGVYKTIERALEVLDDIAYFIISINLEIYQMPEE